VDATRFDNLARALDRQTPRRTALGVFGGGLAGLLTRLGLDEAAAKKRKRKKKLKKNEFGCVNVGGKCRGKDAHCCSGICQGKKPKKGKKDTSKCLAHNVLDCEAGADTCLENKVIPCGTSGRCYQTTGQASFCGGVGANCFGCTKDVECEASKGPGAACVVCPGGCGPNPVTTQCLAAAD
jgi:hypothetical protein